MTTSGFDPSRDRDEEEVGVRLSAVPLWAQIERTLRQMIQSGQWKEGHQLPPEPELAASFGVSRVTVRQAVQRLVDEGRVIRQRGKGSFVTRPPVSRAVNNQYLDGFFATLQAQGHTVLSQVRDLCRVPATDAIAAALGIAPATQVYRLERLRFVDGEAVSIQITCLPSLPLPGLDRFDFAETSLYKVLKEEFTLPILSIEQTISARMATPLQAELLNVAPGSALLYVEKVSRTSNSMPIEFGQLFFVPTRYQLTMSIRA